MYNCLYVNINKEKMLWVKKIKKNLSEQKYHQ